MGFNLIARANNHGMDYGAEMLFEETEILDKAGFVHAGAGRNLSEATMPAYLETGGGRAALVSLCTDFPPHCPAGEQRRDMKGRPGINPLRHDVRYVLDAESFLNLKKICTKLGFKKGIGENNIFFLKNVFDLGDKSTVVWKVRNSDLDRNIRTIKDARRAADYVFVHIHHSTNENGSPALRIQHAARKFIDSGADVIIGDGPHIIQGIEIYKNKPIFYSLGNFFYQSETIKRFPTEFYERSGLDDQATPQDALDMRDKLRTGKVVREGIIPSRVGEWYMRWFETIVAVCDFEDRELTELKVYPVWTYHEHRSQRGRPMLAEEDNGKRIINYLSQCSSQWYTEIDFKEGLGNVKL